ncbi:phospholipase effector Tle1 domain-containing protein [Thalassotalea atypica]|uniref:phospholipase effector Tle1 domain-containing protein n=1 Tax=Thalassotalea atypica TaxID=2054316 RepID=UPI0025736AD1|nr:DUF2235 domain-containing protein [Thalassotalea atypica]
MRKLIFCFDGTCNSPEDSDDYFEDSSVSNILKLHAFFGGALTPLNEQNSNMPNQRSFYYSGVGTRGNWLKQKFNAMFAPPYGDMDDILDEADKDLRDVKWLADDEIFVFGFSRGAALARMFAANIKPPMKVTFLGVFDTVAATRGSLDLNPESFPASGIVFENGTIADHIENALHLLSLDEKRILFQPTLFNADDRVQEVWFSGVHSDIGGGYWFDGLSDITLQFMIDRVVAEFGLTVLDVDDIDFERLKIKGAQDTICKDDLNILPLAKGKMHTQVRTNTNAKTLAPRVPRVNIDDAKSAECPIIHHSVVKRFKALPEYRPYALRDVEYKVMDEQGNLSSKRKGIRGL